MNFSLIENKEFFFDRPFKKIEPSTFNRCKRHVNQNEPKVLVGVILKQMLNVA